MNASKIISLAIISLVSCFLSAMETQKEICLKLSIIEKQLILKEVQQQGPDNILAEIRKKRKAQPIKYDEISGLPMFRVFPALKIEKIFYKADIEKDSLTKKIFGAVQEIERLEKEGLTRPEYDYSKDVDSREYLLGKRTTHQWVKDFGNNDDLTAVEIRSYFQARPYDQKALEDCIENNS